jgi:hypothetical protein
MRMKRTLVFYTLIAIFAAQNVFAIDPPSGLVKRTGDLSVVLHWDKNSDANLAGYRVYRSLNSGGPFVAQGGMLTSPGFCDIAVNNGTTYYYQVTALTTGSQESSPSVTISAVPSAFANDDQFLEYVQQTAFDYFWYLANPTNGLVPDRSAVGSPCSIAAVGFGLTAIGIGVDHGWISRTQGVARVLATLNTFFNGPQGPAISGTIGYNGWFYHFLDMNTALRYTSFNTELSSVDTVLLLAGMLHSKQYFDGTNSDETTIRSTVDTIFNRVNWNWMARGTNRVSMGWFPTTGFINGDWIGYDEGMIIYVLGLGTATNPLPASSWSQWTSGYTWTTTFGYSFVPFPPLFGHQYSHCWIDFRHITDAYMNAHDTTYFENSRRATLAQRNYCVANPLGRTGYSSTNWGLTASDGPNGYQVSGAPPAQNDNGTIAPTAPGGSMAFAPEVCLPTLRAMYKQFRTHIWTPYGFKDAFNLNPTWYGPDELGIDEGPIVIMIENYRTQRPWQLFMRNEEVQRGLQRAGFFPLPFVALNLQPQPLQNSFNLSWETLTGHTYQVEYSPNLDTWFASPTGEIPGAGGATNWNDSGPPATVAVPYSVDQRYYRVFPFSLP